MTPDQASPRIPWLYRLGMTLSASAIPLVPRIGTHLMAIELGRMTAHLTRFQRQRLLESAIREATAEIATQRDTAKKGVPPTTKPAP